MALPTNSASLLLLEQPFLVPPLQATRKLLRQYPRALPAAPPSSNSYDALIAKYTKIRGDLQSRKREATTVLETSRKRIKHLKEVEDIEGLPEGEASLVQGKKRWEEWCNCRLERYIVDYAFREGYYDVASLISNTYDINDYTDAALWKELFTIQHHLQSDTPSATSALQWCKENAQSLKKSKSTLEMVLRLQEFIELCRIGKHFEGLEYFQKHLHPYLSFASNFSMPKGSLQSPSVAIGEWDHNTAIWMSSQITAASALLTYTPRTGIIKYQNLYDLGRWEALSTYFRSTYLSLNNLPQLPQLSLALSAGLACLKTTQCAPLAYNAHPNSTDSMSSPNIEESALLSPHIVPPTLPTLPSELESLVTHPQRSCPLCYSPLSQLADEVPRGHWATSSIVCGISGRVVPGGEELRVLPNGRVYSLDSLSKMAKKYNGRVVCPKTGKEYVLEEDAKKVFIS